ncbi:hypothetical protein N0V84_003632 [Fusarium piperis]|uniref:NAD-dependent epimerase/dehydratase domain-containing protein n=1 Tax=Fusarium piperis TaxID=1435070 RepID=A0A9W8WH07_9HYPO|nr:hypothetical protein N0V84_003632 [Fusarium piperis]
MDQENVLITGATGFLGPILASRLLEDSKYHVYLTDLVPPRVPENSSNPQNCFAIQADLTDPESLQKVLSIAPKWHAIFSFHGIMSVDSEDHPDLSLKVNVDATRAFLLAIAALGKKAVKKPRVIYASSTAVYGTPYSQGLVTDDTPATPDGVYGTHKLMTELFINDLHRRGLLDAFSIRLPAVIIRPGVASRSAAAFLSGMVREPMAGLECVIPTKDRSIHNVICSPRVMVENCVRVMKAPSDAMPRHIRAVYMPGIVVTIQEMIDAFVKVCGEDKLKLLREESDAMAERLLRSWPQNVEFGNAKRMGLAFDESCEQIFQEYVNSLKSL